MLFWEDIIALLVCLKYYYFNVNIKPLCWIFRIWIFIPQVRRITLKLCQVALRIKNSVFIIYLLEDEQELSLGMLDTSPTYLWFLIVPCCYITCFGCLWALLNNFILFLGTNLLTQSPVPVSAFLPISVFRGKGISNGVQTEWNLRRVIFGTEAIQETWSVCQGSNEVATRQGGAPAPLGAPPTLVGPSWLPLPTSFTYICPYTQKTWGSTIDREFRRRKPL